MVRIGEKSGLGSWTTKVSYQHTANRYERELCYRASRTLHFTRKDSPVTFSIGLNTVIYCTYYVRYRVGQIKQGQLSILLVTTECIYNINDFGAYKLHNSTSGINEYDDDDDDDEFHLNESVRR